jgi:hypothetical protein
MSLARMSRVVRPPARYVLRGAVGGSGRPLEGPTNRVGVGGVLNSFKRYWGKVGNPDAPAFQVVLQDILQVNPAHAQPALSYISGFQPYTRTGHLRRWTRTFMSASPRFLGRWAYVGYAQRQYMERARMTGVATRQGTTYKYPRFKVSPRAINLGGGSTD